MASVDYLQREGYLKLLEKHVVELASVPLDQLPTPRALAVDAPWGNGKSWVASRLKEHLTANSENAHKVVLIDAFRQDHNSDAFAVVASAIYKELKPQGEAKKKFLRATGDVLKAGAPAVAKGLVKIGLSALGVADAVHDVADEVTEAVEGAAAKGSEKAVEALLDAYGKNEWAQEQFVQMLDEQTRALQKPVVVLVDELDRCRPSFALAVLERIKHIFNVDKIVFVLFWNAVAINEVVRHTYGEQIDSERYLSKFVAYTLPLPLRSIGAGRSDNAFEHFVQRQLGARNMSNDDLGFGLARLALALQATLRDVERAIHLYCSMPSAKDVDAAVFAYLALLKTISESRFRKVLSSDPQGCAAEAARLEPYLEKQNYGQGLFWALFAALRYRADPAFYENLSHNSLQPPNEQTKTLLEHMFGGQATKRFFDAAASRVTRDLGSA